MYMTHRTVGSVVPVAVRHVSPKVYRSKVEFSQYFLTYDTSGSQPRNNFVLILACQYSSRSRVHHNRMATSQYI